MIRNVACSLLATLALTACAEGDLIGTSGAGGASSGPGGGANGGGEPSGTNTSSSTSSTSSGNNCSESPCKLVEPQCGCGVNEQCTIDDDYNRACAPEGTVLPFDECSADASCYAGSLCVGFGNGPLTCHPYCETDAQCSGPGGRCVYTLLDDANNTVPNLKMCSTSCNIINDAGCNIAGTTCRVQLLTADPVPFTNCFDAGTKVFPAACSTTDECAPGHVCWPASGGGNLCFRWCNVSAPVCPDAGTSCQAVEATAGTPLAIGGINYGLCSG